METREIREKIRQEWLQKPNLSETELEYLNNYYYDDDYYYCEECDAIDSDDNWFWYDGDEYTDYLHIKCNKDKYLEQEKNPRLVGVSGGERIGENRLNVSGKSRVKHYVRCLQE